MATPLDALLQRVARSRLESAAQGVALKAAGSYGPGYPLNTSAPASLLRQLDDTPQLADDIESYLAKRGLEVRGPLSYGEESVLFDAGDGHVVKVGELSRVLDGDPSPFSAPDVAGVAPFLHSDIIGPVRVGVQPRASHVRPLNARPQHRGSDFDDEARRLWDDRAYRTHQVLNKLGYYWYDPHGGNVGLFPDGLMRVIDGAIVPHGKPVIGREEAIRQLRWDWEKRP